MRFLHGIDVLSVPTTYREPKGLYVLEALANGVPVVQPSHGSFPELIEVTGGGILVAAGRSRRPGPRPATIGRGSEPRRRTGHGGKAVVHERFHAHAHGGGDGRGVRAISEIRA